MSNKPGPYGNSRTTSIRSGGDSMGSGCIDAKHPRLVSKRQITKENRLKDELYGHEADKKKSEVSLPKFSWDK